MAAARAVGLRVATGGIFFDGPGVDGKTMPERLAEAEAFFEDFAGAEDVLPGCFPHGAYTVGPDGLQAAWRTAAERGGLFSTHAAETRAEQEVVTARYGRSVIRHLDALGVLDARSVLAHCVWLDDEEIAILARTGASVAHNPMSNLKLASGIARVPDMLAAGVRVTVGTDGAISGNDLDMWMALRLAATLHRGARLDATAVTTGQALRMVTLDGATALGAADRLGSLEVGKLADMILLDLRRPHAAPLFDPATHIVFSTAKSDVRHVFVGGRQVVRDGALTLIDAGEVVDAVTALAPRIAASLRMSERLAAALASIAGRAGPPVEVALILGSGLGRLADAVEAPVAIPYDEIAGFPVPTAPGHAGRLVIGRLHGRRAALMQGRLHLYEGCTPGDIALAVRLLRRLGAERLVVTNAAGALDPEFRPGDIMLIEDHLNFTGTSPLTGPNDDTVGLRFPDMSRAYDPDLRDHGAAGGRGSRHPAPHRRLCRRRRAAARDLGGAALPARLGRRRGGHVDGDRGHRRGARRHEGPRPLGHHQRRERRPRPGARHDRGGARARRGRRRRHRRPAGADCCRSSEVAPRARAGASSSSPWRPSSA